MSTGGVRDLLARIAHLADSGTVEDYLDCFTDDAVWVLSSATSAGALPDRRVDRNDIGDGVRERRSSAMQGPGSNTRHVIATVEVVRESATEAEVISYWLFYVNSVSAPTLSAMGRYDDLMRRDEHGWRVAKRTITAG